MRTPCCKLNQTWVMAGVSIVNSERTPRMAREEKSVTERTVVNISVSAVQESVRWSYKARWSEDLEVKGWKR